MKEILHIFGVILILAIGAYLFGWLFMKGALHQIEDFLSKRVTKYKSKKEEK
jgi:hypothetical protein